MSRQSKRFSAVLVLLAVLCAHLPGPSTAFSAVEQAAPAYHIALLIDRSGSMNLSDPSRLAMNAAKMFVEAMYSSWQEEWGGAGLRYDVDVLPYAEDVQGTDLDPVEIRSEQDVAEVKRRIDAIAYAPLNTGGTDLGRVVQTAADRLAGRDSMRKSVMVLFTDGYTELYSYGNLDAEKIERSNGILQSGIDRCKDLGAEIFVIGLNAGSDANGDGGSINPEGRGAIRTIANETQTGTGLRTPDLEDQSSNTRVNYLITYQMGEIRDFYLKLIAYLRNLPDPIPVPEREGSYEIVVESDEIYQVLIYIFPEEGVQPSASLYSMYSPDGNPVAAEDGGVLQQTVTDGYVQIRLTYPEPGRWLLRYGEENRVAVRYLLVKGFHLGLDAAQTRGEQGSVSLSGMYESNPMDAAFYEDFSAWCRMRPLAGDAVWDVPLQYHPEQNTMLGTLQFPAPGQYLVEAGALVGGREVPSVSKTVTAGLAPMDFSVKVPLLASKQVDFAGRSGWTDLPLEIRSSRCEPEGFADLTAEGSTLRVRGAHRGSSEITLVLEDSYGNQYSVSGSVEVVLNLWLVFLSALLLAVIGAAVWYLFLRQIAGQFSVTLRTGDGREHSLETYPPRGSRTTLLAVINSGLAQIRRMTKPDDPERREAEHLARAIEPYSAVLRSAQCGIVLGNVSIPERDSRTGKVRQRKSAFYLFGPQRRPLSGGEVFRGGTGSDSLIVSLSFKKESRIEGG